MSNTSPTPAPRGGFKWKLLVIGLLAVHFGLMATVALVAGRSDNYTVVPDYYRRAVNFDKEQELKRQSAALGWKVSIHPSTQVDAAGQRGVTFHLVDAQGGGIEDASLDVMYFHHANGDTIRTVRFGPSDCRGGKFSLPLPLRNPGLWEFQLRAEARGQIYIQTTRLMIEGKAP